MCAIITAGVGGGREEKEPMNAKGARTPFAYEIQRSRGTKTSIGISVMDQILITEMYLDPHKKKSRRCVWLNCSLAMLLWVSIEYSSILQTD